MTAARTISQLVPFNHATRKAHCVSQVKESLPKLVRFTLALYHQGLLLADGGLAAA